MPYSNLKPADLLAKLIQEHGRLLVDNPRALASDNADLKHHLYQLQRINLVTVTQHWRQVSKGLQGLKRTRLLDFLLGQLDDHYSRHSLIQLKTAHGTLILGRRWWKQYAPHQTRSKFDDFSFLHMRLILNRKDHFISTLKHKGQFTAFFEQSARGEPFRVGLVCFSGNAKTWFEGTRPLPKEDKVYGFQASHVAPSEAFDAELKACLAWARKEKVHILCLPELCVSPVGRELLKQEIEKEPGSLCLVLPGTFHESDPDGSIINTAPVWLVGANGIVALATYHKGSRFEMSLKKASGLPNMANASKPAGEKGCEVLKEDTLPIQEMCLLSTPIGLIGVMICKDMLVDRISQGYLDLVDHMLVLSMNASPTTIFYGKAESAARNYLTGTFYVNATQVVAADNSSIEMAFWYPPTKVDGKDCRSSFYRKLTPELPLSKSALTKEGYVLFEIGRIPEVLIK